MIVDAPVVLIPSRILVIAHKEPDATHRVLCESKEGPSLRRVPFRVADPRSALAP